MSYFIFSFEVCSNKLFLKRHQQNNNNNNRNNNNEELLTLAATPRSTCSHSDEDLYLAHQPRPLGW